MNFSFENCSASVISLVDDNIIAIDITQTQISPEFLGFDAYLQESNFSLHLGNLLIRIVKSAQVREESEEEQQAHLIYGKIDKICIESLQSFQKNLYKGVGTALMNNVLDYSFKNNYEGRIFLEAARNSHGFYYKLGMRTIDSKINNLIAKNLEKIASGDKTPLSVDFGVHLMYFPQYAFKAYRTIK